MANSYHLDISLARETWAALSSFERGYIETAMWLLTDDDGHSLDYLGLHDVGAGALASMHEDCENFHKLCEEVGLDLRDNYSGGHDFYLTRNRHGAGFWEGPWGESGPFLADLAHTFGKTSWYLGDDNMIHVA